MKWKILNSENVLENEFFKITSERCQKTDGSVVESYYRIERPEVVMIIPITKDQEVVLIEQYRQPVRSTDIELPAGYLDTGESLEQAADRELLEETGYKAPKLEKLQDVFSSAGLMSNSIHFFIAKDAEKIAEPQPEPNEEIIVRPTPIKEAFNLLEQSKIKDMASVLGMHLLKKHLNL